MTTYVGGGLWSPSGITTDWTTGNVYVTETTNATTQRVTRVTPSRALSVVAGGNSGFADGTGTAAKFFNPRGITCDPDGNLYVADTGNNRIRKIDSAALVTTIAGTGTTGGIDGPALSATFNSPQGIARDDAGNLYIVDYASSRVRKLDTAGIVTTIAGTGSTGYADGIGTAASFNSPVGCAVTPDGSVLYVADFRNNCVRAIDLATREVTTYATVPYAYYCAISPVDGLLYVSSYGAVRVYQVSPSRTESIAGNGTAGFSDNCFGDSAKFQTPYGVTVIANNAILVADVGDSRIRKIAPPVFVGSADSAALTDAQADPVVWWAETGRFVESARLNVLAGGDKGKVAEAGRVALAKAGTDAGVFDEATIVSELPLTAADYAAVAESASTQGAIIADDGGTGVDAAAIRVDTSGADIGLFVDGVADVSDGTTPVDADTAVLTAEEAVLGVEGTDTAMFTGEEAVLDEIFHVAAGTETGQVVEFGSVSGDRYLSDADAGTVVDEQALRVTVEDTDSGVFVDAQAAPVDVTYQELAVADAATIADAVTHVGIRPDTDTATLADAESVIEFDHLVGGDSAAVADEAVLVRVTADDTGVISDQFVVPFETARGIDEPETGRFRDRLAILLKHDPTNNGELQVAEQALIGEESLLLLGDIVDDDSGTFVEAEKAYLASRSLSGSDQAAFAEAGVAAKVVADTDTGVVDEGTIVRVASSPSSDEGAAVEGDAVILIMVADADTTTGTDEASAWVDTNDADSGVLVEDVVGLGVPATMIGDADAGTVTEQATHVEFSRVAVAADTGHLIDSADLAVADIFVTTADTATAGDSETPWVNVAGSDRAAIFEVEVADDGNTQYRTRGDSGRLTDAVRFFGRQAGADTARATETEIVNTVERVAPAVGVWDRGNIIDAAVSVHLWAGDAVSIADRVSDLFEARRTPGDKDGGRLRDRLAILLTSDPDAGLDGLRVDEQGTFSEAADVPGSTIGLDNGGLADSEELFGDIPDGDTATMTAETEDLVVAPQGTDSARLVIEDSGVIELVAPTVAQTSDDSGAFSEIPPVIALSDDDIGLLADTPDPVVGPLSDDDATISDDLLVVGLVCDDTAALSDTQTPVIALTADETGTFDEPSSQVGIADDDSGVTTEADALFVTLSVYDFGPFDDEVAESTAQVPADDTGAFTEGELLFAEDTDDDGGAFVDTASLLAAVLDTDTATLTEAEELSAAAEDADTARFTETAVVRVDLGGGQTGLLTNDSGLITEDQDVSAQVPADDIGAFTDAENLFVTSTDAEIGLFADDQALTVRGFADDTGRLTEAALLFSDTGTGAFTGEDGRFTEAATVVTSEAFVYPQDDDAITVAETQSVRRSNPNQPWIEFRPGSLLKVNVVARRVYLTDYFTADEYPIRDPLPDAARFKLDAFGAVLTPNAREGDELEDADFRYHYEARWVTPNRRETGWYIVAWRRSPEDGPTDWLA